MSLLPGSSLPLPLLEAGRPAKARAPVQHFGSQLGPLVVGPTGRTSRERSKSYFYSIPAHLVSPFADQRTPVRANLHVDAGHGRCAAATAALAVVDERHDLLRGLRPVRLRAENATRLRFDHGRTAPAEPYSSLFTSSPGSTPSPSASRSKVVNRGSRLPRSSRPIEVG